MMLRKRNGIYAATVLEAGGSTRAGQARVSIPALRKEVWARVATLTAGDHRGSWFPPETGDEVLVAFDGGDVRRPFVVGSFWGKSTPPESSPDRKVLRTRHGATIVLDDAARKIEVKDDNGNEIELTTSGLRVTAATQVKVTASTVELETPVARFAGVVQCETLMATSVVASSYTPGAGNVL